MKAEIDKLNLLRVKKKRMFYERKCYVNEKKKKQGTDKVKIFAKHI